MGRRRSEVGPRAAKKAVAGSNSVRCTCKRLLHWARRTRPRHTPLGAVSAGSYRIGTWERITRRWPHDAFGLIAPLSLFTHPRPYTHLVHCNGDAEVCLQSAVQAARPSVVFNCQQSRQIAAVVTVAGLRFCVGCPAQSMYNKHSLLRKQVANSRSCSLPASKRSTPPSIRSSKRSAACYILQAVHSSPPSQCRRSSARNTS